MGSFDFRRGTLVTALVLTIGSAGLTSWSHASAQDTTPAAEPAPAPVDVAPSAAAGEAELILPGANGVVTGPVSEGASTGESAAATGGAESLTTTDTGIAPSAAVWTVAGTDAEVPESIGATQDSFGDLTYSIPFAVPEYRGLERALGINYRSRRVGQASPDDIVGAGWRLGGFSEIRRATPGRGLPAYDANDI